MNDLCIFLNTRVVDTDSNLVKIGDAGLTPVRYLFNGRDCEMNDEELNIKFLASNKRMIKTALAIIFLIPGLLLSICKALAYAFSSTRDRHNLIKEMLEPVEEQIVSRYSDLERLANFASSDPSLRFNTLICYPLSANEELKLLIKINPMKFIYNDFTIPDNVKNELETTGKWIIKKVQSKQEALEFEPPRRGWFTCKRYHVAFEVKKRDCSISTAV